ncbi:MAG TPA: c-type cytochrome [Bryobacterales bacterium]|nr:c-type cytochrome [Bryobacterales bacterium]
MPAAEEMGKISRRLRLAFAISCVLFVTVLAVSPVKDSLREWRHYKRDYVRYAQGRPDTKRLLADIQPGIDQIWIPEMNVVDRCTTCHQGITEPSLHDPAVPQPYRAHPLIPHQVKEWGCVVCHRGQGPATEVAEAHETTLAWEEPLLPNRYIQASCGSCHRGDLPETPQLDRGRQLLDRLNCVGCHRLEGIDRPPMIGPDLTNVGNKVTREWIYKWLKEPRTITDANGNVTVNGYELEEEPRMPQFRLTEGELVALSAFLSTRKGRPVEPYKFDPRVVAAWGKRPDLASEGEARFREMFCTTCHSVAVTRGGETKLIGGDIGPELTKVASKVNPDWLVAWLRDPQAYLPHGSMPRYGWSDEDLYLVTRYITGTLTDPDLLANVPKLPSPQDEQVQLGRRLFAEKGCVGCHVIQGISATKDFAPDLTMLGAKNVSQLEFGDSKIPRHLISYIQAKITNPLSVNPAARMPQYHLAPEDLDAITTALLSMTGTPSGPGLERLVVPAPRPQFHPAGEFGELFDRFQCAACHRFNGYGGTLAPDLSFEGSRAQRKWLAAFLKSPQTLRPTLTFRMPKFTMTDQEANVLADYMAMVFQAPSVNPRSVDDKQFTSAQAAMGKQIYELKYQCQACHTIGSSGGYVGPNLSNVGNWMNAAWIEQWLRNPQALVPGATEPRRAFTDQEVTALTAYLLTLRQTTGAKAKTGNAAGAGGSQ